jgi:deoxyribonuclease IV
MEPPDAALDLLGAHVSTAGGCSAAPARAAEIRSQWVQIFTKQPQRWAEPVFDAEYGRAYRAACAEHDVIGTTVHASYLINAASPDPILQERSVQSLAAEYRRSGTLGAAQVVVHPGAATDGDREAGLIRNAAAARRVLRENEGETILCLENTTGKGTVLGKTFEELARLLELVEEAAPELSSRIGICLDTCHLYAAGYDIRNHYAQVLEEFDRLIGVERIRVWHVNDSQGTLGSGTDRHAWIGEGEIGLEGFRQLVRDERFSSVPMLLETPKGDDHTASDRRNLELLRSLRE